MVSFVTFDYSHTKRMILPYFLLVAITACYNQQKVKKASTKMQFPDDLQTFCPHTKFCDLDPLVPLNKSADVNHVTYSPCCKPCSCAKDCGLRRECCDDKFDHYRLDHILQPACKALNTKTFNNPDEQLYYIIDVCPNQLGHNNSQNETSNTRRKCSNHTKPNSHGYFPVYSQLDGRVYYNEQCALCHNQTNLQTFIPTIKCLDVRNSFTKILTEAFGGAGHDPDCFLQYLVPSHIDISSEKCYREIIRECRNQQLGGVELENRCRSFNASFDDSNKRYGNVYCYLCASKIIQTKESVLKYNRMCPEYNHQRFNKDASFVGLLNVRMLKRIRNTIGDPRRFYDMEKVCFESVNKTRDCRIVYCPEGHFRVGKSCSTLGQTWYLHNVQIYIRLTPSGSLMLTKSDVHHIISEQILNNDKSQIRRHGFKSWTINLFYNSRKNSTTVPYFIAVVSLKKTCIKSETLLKVIYNSLNTDWDIAYNGVRFKFNAEFNRFTKYYERKSPNSFLMHPLMITSEQNTTSMDESLALENVTEAFERGYLIHRFLITKLFFCRQIELKSGDFREELDRIYLIKQNKYLWSGEYVVSEYNHGHISALRVCLEDILSKDLSFDRSSIDILSCKHIFLYFTISFLTIHVAV